MALARRGATSRSGIPHGGARSTGPTTGSGLDDSSPPQVTFPKTNKDPVWSLCPWPVEITLDSQTTITIPAEPAVTWLQYLLSDDPDFNGIINDMMPELDDYYFEHELSSTDLFKKMLEVITVASGRNWWVTLRLTAVAAGAWHILGPQLLMNGVDATVVSLSAWLDGLLYLCIENMDPKDTAMFSMQLEIEPKDSIFLDEDDAVDRMETMAVDEASFLAMAR